MAASTAVGADFPEDDVKDGLSTAFHKYTHV